MRASVIFAAALALLLVGLAGCKSVKGDLKVLCQIAGEVDGDATIAPENKSRELYKRFADSSPSSDMSTAWEALPHAAEDKRYPLIQRVAQEAGEPGWSCPALKKVWTQ